MTKYIFYKLNKVTDTFYDSDIKSLIRVTTYFLF